MTNSDPLYEARQRLDTILVLLDETLLMQCIDGPIQKTASAFKLPEGNAHFATPSAFLDVAEHYLAHLRGSSSLPPGKATRSARNDAWHLLEQHYENGTSRGYGAAFLDAQEHGNAGLQHVLTQLAQYHIATERAAYSRCVLHTHIDPLDWPQRCALMEALLERIGTLLPGAIRQASPAQLIDAFPVLLEQWMSSQRFCNQLLRPPVHTA